MTYDAIDDADVFEDEDTRELPSALRTFTDTVVLPPISRPISIPALALDIAPPRPRPTYASMLTAERAAALSRDPLALLAAAALLVACVLAGALGIVVGRTSASGARSAQAGSATGGTGATSTSGTTGATERTPRLAVVFAAHESMTSSPLMAPAKDVAAPSFRRATPSASASSAPPPPAHRAGFQRPAGLPRR